MGIFDQVRKNKQEQAQKENPTTPPPEGHSLKEILADKHTSHLFGKFLDTANEADRALATRISHNTLNEEDIALLEEKRKIFSERMVRAEKIEKSLTIEVIIDLARKNKDFEKVVNQLTPEGAVKMITGQLREISVTDHERFNNIASSVEKKESYESGEYRKTEEKVEELLESKKITPEEYSEAMAIKDPKEKKEALNQLSYRTYGIFKRTLSHLPKGSGLGDWARKSNPLKDLKKAEASIGGSIAELDRLNKGIGAALFMTVKQNESMRKAFSHELTGKKIPEESKGGFQEAQGVTFDEKGYDKAWEEKKKKTKYNGSGVAAEAKTAIENEFREEQNKLLEDKHSRKGIWHRIAVAIVKGLINGKKLS